MLDASTWIPAAVARVREGRAHFHLDTRHLDELGMVWAGISDVPRVLDEIRSGAGRLPDGCRVALAVPLAESADMPRSRPGLHDLVPDEHEPPSIYVLGDLHLASAADTSDRLHLPYPTTPWGPSADVHVELVARRDREAAEHGWGWTNTLWIHLLPAVEP